jgi:hypothetical protein
MADGGMSNPPSRMQRTNARSPERVLSGLAPLGVTPDVLLVSLPVAVLLTVLDAFVVEDDADVVVDVYVDGLVATGLLCLAADPQALSAIDADMARTIAAPRAA